MDTSSESPVNMKFSFSLNKQTSYLQRYPDPQTENFDMVLLRI